MISAAAREAAMISASVDDSAIECCRVLAYATVALPYTAHHPRPSGGVSGAPVTVTKTAETAT
eukprot:1555280-Prymnesium_polylepis.1